MLRARRVLVLLTSLRWVSTVHDRLHLWSGTRLFLRIVALRTYEHMLKNDAQVRASIRACKIPVLGGDWYVEPASNEQEDKDIAEFIEFNLFQNQSITWSKILEHALTMLDYGSLLCSKRCTNRLRGVLIVRIRTVETTSCFGSWHHDRRVRLRSSSMMSMVGRMGCCIRRTTQRRFRRLDRRCTFPQIRVVRTSTRLSLWRSA